MIKHLALLCIICISYTATSSALPKNNGKNSDSSPVAEANTLTQESNKSFWISSTGKTHNKNCRYFGKGKGKRSDTPTDKNCQICGGSGKKETKK